MYKIAFLGDRKSLLMYKTTGFTLLSPDTEIEIKKDIEKLKSENYALILVSEHIYQLAPNLIKQYDDSFLPAIIVLPGFGEEDNVGIHRMHELMESAVGMKFN